MNKAKAQALAQEQVGDYKTPNKYWVSVGNSYLYHDAENDVWEGIDDLKLFESKGETIDVFRTFKEAMEFIESEMLFGNEYDGYKVNTVTIEDRLTGVLWEKTYWYDPATAEIEERASDDTRYTREELAKRGIKFI